MTPKTLPVLEQCISSGVRLGINRSKKHTDTPTEQHLIEHIERAVWEQLYDAFHFDEVRGNDIA